MIKRKHLGSTLDSFFVEEGMLDEVIDLARKKVIADQIRHEMKRRRISPTVLARRMKTSRAVVYRLLDAEEGVTLDVLERMSHALDMDLVIKLVSKRPNKLAARRVRSKVRANRPRA